MIPARGGSKGIPRKNVLPVAGKPLLAHSIEQAKAAVGIDEVVVSTDDAEISALARRMGAQVVDRPPALATDSASSESALLHVLDTFEAGGQSPDVIVFLQATSPIRTADEIDRALETFDQSGADSLFSATRLHGFLWRIENGSAKSLNYDHTRRPRRQEAPLDVVENGSIYIFKPWVIREFGNRLGGKIAVHLMADETYFQIDEPRDLEIVSALFLSGPPARSHRRFRAIELLVLDFDGVMTDNTVMLDESGTEHVRCSRADGLGLSMLMKAGVRVAVLSSETNGVVVARCAKLGIQCRNAVDEKVPELERIAEEHGVSRERVCYVGNDLNDLACLRWAGVGVAVSDAHLDILKEADLVTQSRGGDGAVREVCDWILRARGVG